MSTTTLRAYIREIDGLVEQEHLDEAIAHSRYILQTFPKYVECYRLLGKAYLEAKRFGDAADIFQRVLSAVPDDFVSHIGMSIVREDEGNLDSAIWHMERAFETNPANPAIQQELKRLIGRRDGFEPHKVRLTRGALARMYSQGELYPQAIAELRSALQEDPDRPDLQALLAQLNWQIDQRREAAEISGTILEKLPFCMLATRITAAVLQASGKADEASAYHRRLAQLDPYMAYIESPMADPGRVDSESIQLEKLSWRPGQPLPATDAAASDWAASLGLDAEGDEAVSTGPLPSWLNEVQSEADGESAPTPEPAQPAPEAPVEEPEASPAEGASIPDWMQEAGWQESQGEAEEAPVSFSAQELDALERGELAPEPVEADGDVDELAPAELPSWLQGRAPEADAADNDSDEAELAAILGASPAAAPEMAEAAADAPAGEDDAQDIPGWLDEGEPGATNTIMTWLDDRAQPDEDEVAEETPIDELPDWMSSADDLGAEDAPAEADAGSSEPGWLSGVAEAAADSQLVEDEELAELRRSAELSSAEEETPAAGAPDWLQQIASPGGDEIDEFDEAEARWEEEVSAAEQDTVPQMQTEDAPDWIGRLDETDEPMQPVEAEGADWMMGLEDDSPADKLETAADSPEAWLEQLGDEQAEAAESAPVPDWMSGIDEELEAEGRSQAVESMADSWLSDLSDTLAETPAEPPEPVSEAVDDDGWIELGETAEPTAAADPADQEEDLSWLGQFADAGEAESSEAPSAAAEVDLSDESGVFDWLDQLAANAVEEETYEEPDTQPSGTAALGEAAPPDNIEEGLEWLDRLSDARGIDAEIATAAPSAPIPSSETEPAAVPDPFDELPPMAEPEFPGLAEPPDDAAELPPQMGFEPEAEEAEVMEPTDFGAPLEFEPDDSEPEELSESEAAPLPPAVPEPMPEAEADEPVEEVPDWLRPHSEDSLAFEPASESEPEPEPEPAPEPELELEPEPEPEPVVASSSAEAEDEEVPDWIKAQVEAAPSETELVEPEAAAEEVEAAPSVDELAQPEPVMAEAEPAAATIEEVMDSEPEAAAMPEPEESLPAPVEPESEAGQPAEEPIVAMAEPEAAEPVASEPPATQEPVPPEPVAEDIEPELPGAEPVETSAEMEAAEAEAVEAAAETPEPETEAKARPVALDAAIYALGKSDYQSAASAFSDLISSNESLNEVIELLEEAVAGDVDSAVLWQTLGDAYMRINRAKDAAKAYERGMGNAEILEGARKALAAGESAVAATQYGLLIKGNDELEAVIADLEKAVASGGGTAELWQALGDAYMKDGRVDDSIEAYRQGMESV